jgi:hypothetical protein
MRTFVLVGAAALAIAGVGGAFALNVSRADVDRLAVRERAVAPAPLPATQDASVVWADEEFIVWGGGSGDKVDWQVHADGAAYHPTTDSWRTLAPAPIEARERHTAAWTGSEMIVWGGTRRHYGVGDLLDGARYDPVTDTWRTMSPAPAGTDRSGGQAAVVDDLLVIGAGYGPTSDEERTILVYDLSEDRWDTVPVADRVIHLLPIDDQVAVLTARQALRGETDQLRVELLDPATGDLHPVGQLELETYPSGAGLLAHDGDLTLVVSSDDGESALYPIELDGYGARLVADRVVDLAAPVRLDGFSQLQPVLHDGDRRVLIGHMHGLVAGIDLVSGDVAQGGHLDGAATCLPNASFGVAGARLLIWGVADCTAEPDGPERPVLVEVAWDAATP